MKYRGVQKSDKIYYLPISEILPNPYQLRKSLKCEELEELAASIRRYGVLQPILVRVINKSLYELVSGERRLRASKLIGFEHIPCILVSLGDRDVAAVCMNENIHRSGYNYLEETEGIRLMREGFNYSERETAAMLEVSRADVARQAELLGLNKQIRLRLYRLGLSEDRARELLELGDDTLINEILDDAESFKMSEDSVKALIASTCRRKGIVSRIGQLESRYHSIRNTLESIRLVNEAMKRTMLILKDCGIKSEYRVEKNKDNYELNLRLPITTE